MTDTKTVAPQTRVRRPDAAVVADTDTDGVKAANQDGDSTDADNADEDDTKVVETKAKEKTAIFTPPFLSNGVVVNDSAGRIVCTVAGAHMTLDARAEAASFITSKLNA